MSDYLIKEETLNNLANSVRAISGENTKMNPDQMVMTMNNTKSAMDALDEHNSDENAHADIRALAAEKEIFKARYGTATSAEIEAAYQAGKFCICVSANGKVVYTLYDRKVANQHYFVNEAAGVIACKADVWSDEGTVAQLIGSPTVVDMNTALDGKVSKGGDMMTGQLHIDTTNTNQGVIVGGNNTTSYFASIGTDGINYQRTLQIVNNSTDANSMNAMKYAVWTNGVEETYPVLHTGNKNQIFTYGTEDLTAGSSPLATGQLHFVYE